MAVILVVEDDRDTRELVSRYLVFSGHVALAAADGAEGLWTLERGPVDLILLDMTMPGMDGSAFLEALRAAGRHADTPVVVCSALPRERLRSAVAHLGVADVLSKADGYFIDLMEVVARHVRRRPAEPSPTGLPAKPYRPLFAAAPIPAAAV